MLLLLGLLFVVIGQCLAENLPTIVANKNFDATIEAEKLSAAIREMNTSNIIAIICSINNNQRQQLSEEFQKANSKNVVEAMKENVNTLLDDSFWKTMFALMKPSAVYDASYLRGALSSKLFPVLFEILATRTNEQIAELKDAYEEQSNKKQMPTTLEDDIKTGTNNETETVDEELARNDAKKLYSLSQKEKTDTVNDFNPSENDHEFNKVFAERNFKQLRLTFDFYKQVAQFDIEKGIKKEFGDANKAGYLALIKYLRNRPMYFADLLHHSVEAFPINDFDLIRLLVTRSEVDLAEIKRAYHLLHEKTLQQAVKATTSRGAFRNALLALLDGNVEVPKVAQKRQNSETAADVVDADEPANKRQKMSRNLTV
ncbi:hypothetical protein niasHT_033386 [Heterodera trifolii]|uniref:Annexin n=1 Tax=Heterodera trifolii TaxID=157864 RepID=A0ABD2HPW6_9BILA